MAPPQRRQGFAKSDRSEGRPETAGVPGCAGTGWREYRIDSLSLQQTGIVGQQATLGDTTIIVRNRFLVLLQPAPFLLGPHETAQALLQGVRDVDVHPPRLVEQFDIDEQVDGAFLRLPGASHGFSLSCDRGRRCRRLASKPWRSRKALIDATASRFSRSQRRSGSRRTVSRRCSSRLSAI